MIGLIILIMIRATVSLCGLGEGGIVYLPVQWLLGQGVVGRVGSARHQHHGHALSHLQQQRIRVPATSTGPHLGHQCGEAVHHELQGLKM